jgi:uncharacterized protein (TIGR01777 family)
VSDVASTTPMPLKSVAGLRVVIAGANGFVGTYLTQRFITDGASVATIGRSGADATWGDTAALTRVLDGADLLINLAGKSVNCRYTDSNRAAIFSSRLLTTEELGRVVSTLASPPSLWLNASTATIYRHADDRAMTDEDGEIGSGFSVNVATSWEREFFAHDVPSTRQVALRMAIVLGDGSALTPLLWLTRLGLGGPQYGGKSRGGRQRFSWIHIDDLYRSIRFIRDTPPLSGTVNLSSPGPVENRELMSTLRRVLSVPVGIPLFSWMLHLGAWAIRTETELLLKSRWVLPTRLQGAGFVFEYPEIDGALRDITGTPTRGPHK